MTCQVFHQLSTEVEASASLSVCTSTDYDKRKTATISLYECIGLRMKRLIHVSQCPACSASEQERNRKELMS
jgi:hypothetical protein